MSPHRTRSCRMTGLSRWSATRSAASCSPPSMRGAKGRVSSPGKRSPTRAPSYPHLITAPADPAKDARALMALARWAGRYSPPRNVDGLDGLWLEITGIPHLFGGEDALLAHLAARLAGLSFTARLALAPDFGRGARARPFRSRAPHHRPPGQDQSGARRPPRRGLAPRAFVVSLLKRLGLKRIGQLYDLPRASLQQRFHSKDAAETVLLRLDQALGAKEEPKPAPSPRAPSCRAARLPRASHHGGGRGRKPRPSRRHAVRHAYAQGTRAPSACASHFIAATAPPSRSRPASARPPATPQHLLLLLQDKVANLDAGFGIDLMRLAAHCRRAAPARPDHARRAAQKRRRRER